MVADATGRDAGKEVPPWVRPGEPLPVRLMNTIWADRAGVHDSLTGPDAVGAWLGAVQLIATPLLVTAEDYDDWRRLRDALRRLAALSTDDPRPVATTMDGAEAVAEVNAAISSAPVLPRLELDNGGLRRSRRPPDQPVQSALSTVAAEAVDLLTDPERPALGACQAPGCVLYFVRDHPRREWCSSACGNRARAARHYRRHRDQPAERPST